MNTRANDSPPLGKSRWTAFLEEVLREGSEADRQKALDFLGQQSTLLSDEILPLRALIERSILDPDAQTRYFARKARAQFEKWHPIALEPEPAPVVAEGGLPPREILLRKMRLGSRYVAFEAMERLTESRDPTLAEPLIRFLEDEKDPYKISFLVKRLPRLPHPSVVDVMARFLEHTDLRVVANALEGICELRVPQLRDALARLADSPDNRIRANAIRALHAYEPDLAQQHLQAMLESPLISLQDSGVYLLNLLKPRDLDRLQEIALSSKYATIRLRALEIPRHAAPPPPSRRSDSVLHSGTDHKGLRGLGMSLGIATGLVFLAVFLTRGMLSVVFLVAAGGMALLFRKPESIFTKAMASSAFIACLIWGEVRFIPLLGVLAVWIPPTTLRRADPEFLARLLTWCFALLAILISHLLQSDLIRTIHLAADFTIPEGPAALPLAEAIAQHKQFGVILFAVVALVIFTLQAINRWYPSRQDPAAEQKRLVMVFGVGLVLVVVLNVSYLMGSQISLAVKGLKTPSAILRPFGE